MPFENNPHICHLQLLWTEATGDHFNSKSWRVDRGKHIYSELVKEIDMG